MRRTVLLAVLLASLVVLFLQLAQVRADAPCSEPPLRGGDYMYVPVDMGDGRMIKALVDTGATSTVISRCAIEQFALKKKTNERAWMVFANGTVGDAEMWLVTFQVGPYAMVEFRAHVVDNATSPMIVGMDVLGASNAVIYPREKVVIFLDQEAHMTVE